MLKILYEDNHLIVCIKPCNVPVQEDVSKDPDMLTMLKQYIKEKYDKPGDVFLGLVHRLDRPVGGVMVFARTSKAAARLSELIRQQELGRGYLAVVEGVPEKESGEFVDFLYKDDNRNKVHVVKVGTEGAKNAILNYNLIDSRYSSESRVLSSLVKINLITGRAHQIRVQFASRGLPIIGDNKYGKSKKSTSVSQESFTDNIMLWSYSLKFKHPTKDKTMYFKVTPNKEAGWTIFNYSKLEEK